MDTSSAAHLQHHHKYKAHCTWHLTSRSPTFDHLFLKTHTQALTHTHTLRCVILQIWALHWTSSGCWAGSVTWNMASLLSRRCALCPPLWHGHKKLRDIFQAASDSNSPVCVCVCVRFKHLLSIIGFYCILIIKTKLKPSPSLSLLTHGAS